VIAILLCCGVGAGAGTGCGVGVGVTSDGLYDDPQADAATSAVTSRRRFIVPPHISASPAFSFRRPFGRFSLVSRVTGHDLLTRSRRELVRRKGFGIEGIVEFDAPREWPSTGFQLGMVLLTRGYHGACAVDRLRRSKLRSESRRWKRGRLGEDGARRAAAGCCQLPVFLEETSIVGISSSRMAIVSIKLSSEPSSE
jgi:hypothetical protein